MHIVLLRSFILYLILISSSFGDTTKQDCRSYAEWDNVRHCLLDIDRPEVTVAAPNEQTQQESEGLPIDNSTIVQLGGPEGPPPGLAVEDIPEQ